MCYTCISKQDNVSSWSSYPHDKAFSTTTAGSRFKEISGTGHGSIYIDSMIWGGKIWNTDAGPVKVTIGRSQTQDSDLSYNQAAAVHGSSDYMGASTMRYQWFGDRATDPDAPSLDYALSLYSSVANIEFDILNPDDISEANIVWWKTDLPSGALGIHETPDSVRPDKPNSEQRWGYFDPNNHVSWQEQSPGGDGLNTIIHEIGHGLGLAHPHDGGARADRTTFPGATGSQTPGEFGLNQSVFSVMSYVPGHNSAKGDSTYGTQYGLGAFDIAALQKMYGANMETAQGNDTYELPTQNGKGTGWFCIWDTGGIDTITGAKSTTGVTIDLRAATMIDHDPNAGGFLSRQPGIAGGVTIANKVVIENATGSNGNDTLIGNAAANTLNGGLGNDVYHIDGANDVILDAGGNDTVYATFNYSNPNIENIYVNGVLTQSGGAVVRGGFAIHQGTSGKDAMAGTDGNDKMYGLGGNDILIGSKGLDIFVFNTKLNAKTNKDSVQGFVTKEDKIWLDNKIFKKLGKGSEMKPEKLKKNFFKVGSSAGDTDDFIIFDKKKGIMSYDVDGNGSQKAVAFATFDKKNLPNVADLFVV